MPSPGNPVLLRYINGTDPKQRSRAGLSPLAHEEVPSSEGRPYGFAGDL